MIGRVASPQHTLYKAVKPDPVAFESSSRVACISTVAEAIRAKLNPNPADSFNVLGAINALLDESIIAVPRYGCVAWPRLTKIQDFEFYRN